MKSATAKTLGVNDCFQFAKHLKGVGLFNNFSDQQILEVLNKAQHRSCPLNQLLLIERQIACDFFLVIEGKIEIEMQLHQPSQEKILAQISPGEIIGELALVGIKRRTASARALINTQLLSWDVAEMMLYLDSNPLVGYHFMKNLASILAKRVVSTNQELRNTCYQFIYQ